MPAVGLRCSARRSASGASSWVEEELTLYAFAANRLKPVLTTLMSQAGEVQGDWPKGGGDRPYVSNDADATLEILTATTNGHFVLRKRWKGADAPPPEDFRWRNGQYQGDE